jgi:vitamin K-dependent gamma-carboxylase
VGMYSLFVAIVLLGLCVAAGMLYRLTSVLLAASFTYVFLLDRTNYQNHYYLLALISWLMTFLPAHRAFSWDATHHPAIRSQTAPCWTIWLLRFQLGLPYFFGGVAKLNADWIAGEPIRQILASQASLPVIGPLFNYEATVALIVWGGLLFDLSIVPLLLWRKTRARAYGLCVLFHVTNSVLFDIHVFPWFMIFATTVFFEPDWPRRLLGGSKLSLPAPPAVSWTTLPGQRKPAIFLLLIYCAFQIGWPLRHYLYRGDVSWTEQGQYFAWRMLVRGKMAGVRYYLTDTEKGVTGTIDLRAYINDEQAGRFPRDPEMILDFAHFLADEFGRETGREAEVRALVLMSLNGRKPQLFIDPNVDLAKEPRGFHERLWIMPQNEPLRAEPWSVPLVEWERHVTLPPLPFLQSTAPSADRD